MTAAESSEAWLSYLMPGTDTLRTLPGFYDPVAAALFEQITSADAETTLRRTSDRPRTFDLDRTACATSTAACSVTSTSGQ